MRTCGLCRKAPRGDDPCGAIFLKGIVSHVEVGWSSPPTGLCFVCNECRCRETGETFTPRRYEAGGYIPPGVIVCGICRLAMHEDESAEAMRLQPEDVACSNPPLAPGCYLACPACVDHYRPMIHARLVAIGEFAPGTPLSACRRNALL
jgi:hypothetical protein